MMIKKTIRTLLLSLLPLAATAQDEKQFEV